MCVFSRTSTKVALTLRPKACKILPLPFITHAVFVMTMARAPNCMQYVMYAIMEHIVPPGGLPPLGLGAPGPAPPPLLLGVRGEVARRGRRRGGRGSAAALEEHLHPRDDLLRRPEAAHRAAAVRRGLRGRRDHGYVGQRVLGEGEQCTNSYGELRNSYIKAKSL